MPKKKRHVYCQVIVRKQEDDSEVHRIDVHSSPDSSNRRQFEEGLIRKVDFERFYTEWTEEVMP